MAQKHKPRTAQYVDAAASASAAFSILPASDTRECLNLPTGAASGEIVFFEKRSEHLSGRASSRDSVLPLHESITLMSLWNSRSKRRPGWYASYKPKRALHRTVVLGLERSVLAGGCTKTFAFGVCVSTGGELFHTLGGVTTDSAASESRSDPTTSTAPLALQTVVHCASLTSGQDSECEQNQGSLTLRRARLSEEYACKDVRPTEGTMWVSRWRCAEGDFEAGMGVKRGGAVWRIEGRDDVGDSVMSVQLGFGRFTDGRRREIIGHRTMRSNTWQSRKGVNALAFFARNAISPNTRKGNFTASLALPKGDVVCFGQRKLSLRKLQHCHLGSEERIRGIV
ncbi:hypothetical protein R3P38DRAFT_3190654 [Favolaschia claudopus]|uniref:Uncharacterized protein n=1 Tax=Favolaschia claudopus TaxID=2862362 RepID=A0AAW0BNA0_9AGAR